MLFQTNEISKQNYKLSTKLMLWLLDKHIDRKAIEIVDIQTEKAETQNMENYTYSSAGKAKIRYVAGACVCKISKKNQGFCLKQYWENFQKKVKLQENLTIKCRHCFFFCDLFIFPRTDLYIHDFINTMFQCTKVTM